MAASQTDRLEIFTWSSGADTFTRTQMNTSHDKLEALGAGFDQAGSTVPTAKAIAKYKGFFHYSTSNTDTGTLSYCNGAAWFEIGKPGSAVAIDGTLADGSSTLVARADHKHSISNNTITNAMMADNAINTDELADNAVTTIKITNAHVTNDKLAASGLDISKMTTGTLDVGRIGAGTILNAKLGSDIDAGKITAGTLPIARIATSAVTHEKIEDSAGLSVIGRSASSGGVVADITAGNDNEVLLRNGTSLEFAKIDTDNITANAVDVEQMQQVSGHAILGRVGSTPANLTQIVANTENTVLGRTTGNLTFGKVTNAQLAGSIEDAKIISLAATKITGTIDTDQIASDAITNDKIDSNAVTLGTQTSGAYVRRIIAGTSIDVSSNDTETSSVTVTHADTSTLSGIYGGSNNGVVIEDFTVDSRGHVTAIGTRDLDGRFLHKDDTYGDSSATDGRRIFVQSGTPSYGASGNLWFQI